MLRELDTAARAPAEQFLREAVEDMARLAREESEALKARNAALEVRPGAPSPAVD